MSISSPLSEFALTEVKLVNAVSIVIATAPFGHLVGTLATVHLIPSETIAVWLTTIAFAVMGLLVWTLARS